MPAYETFRASGNVGGELARAHKLDVGHHVLLGDPLEPWEITARDQDGNVITIGLLNDTDGVTTLEMTFEINEAVLKLA